MVKKKVEKENSIIQKKSQLVMRVFTVSITPHRRYLNISLNLSLAISCIEIFTKFSCTVLRDLEINFNIQ